MKSEASGLALHRRLKRVIIVFLLGLGIAIAIMWCISYRTRSGLEYTWHEQKWEFVSLRGALQIDNEPQQNLEKRRLQEANELADQFDALPWVDGSQSSAGPTRLESKESEIIAAMHLLGYSPSFNPMPPPPPSVPYPPGAYFRTRAIARTESRGPIFERTPSATPFRSHWIPYRDVAFPVILVPIAMMLRDRRRSISRYKTN